VGENRNLSVVAALGLDHSVACRLWCRWLLVRGFAGGRSCPLRLSFDILGVCVLALPLLNLNEIRWRSTIGGLGRERREALQARYQGYIGLALAVLGFVLQGIGVITSVGVAAP
jgi:hypothetical protein